MATASASSQPVSGQPATPPQEDTQNTSPPTEGGRPSKDYVRLYTNDKHSFYIDCEYALVSPKLKAMMRDPNDKDPNGKELNDDAPNKKAKPLEDVWMRDMSSHLVSKVCEYFVYNKKYRDFNKDIPSFPIKTKDASALLEAAYFLEC